MKTSPHPIAVLIGAAYIGSIVAAAAAVEYIGPVPVWPGVLAPAGVYVVGITMVLRDITQDKLGALTTFWLMLLGACLSAMVSPAIAFAAAIGFFLSQTLDMIVYTPIRKHTLIGAVLASNAVGIVADTVIFLQLAFGNLDYFVGQIIGKTTATLFAVAVLAVIYRKRPIPATHTERLAA